MMTTIAYFALLAAALLDFCAMTRLETHALQRNDYRNSRYYSWLTTGDELTATKRLLILAVLIGCCTTMAQMSWIVVMILAATLAIQGIMLLKPGNEKATLRGKRATAVCIAAIALAILIAGISGWLSAHMNMAEAPQAAAIAAVMALAVSPLLTMLANLLVKPFGKRA